MGWEGTHAGKTLKRFSAVFGSAYLDGALAARLANVKPLDGVAFPVARRRGATIFGVAMAWGGRAPTPGKP